MAGVHFQASFRARSAGAPATSTAGANARFYERIGEARSEMKQLAAAHPSVPEGLLPDIAFTLGAELGGNVDTRA